MASPIKYNAQFQQTKSLGNETKQFNDSLMRIAKPTSVYLNNKLVEQQKQFNADRDDNTGKMLEAVMNGTTVPEFDNYDPTRFAKGKLDIDKVQSAIDLNTLSAEAKAKEIGYMDDNQAMKEENHNQGIKASNHGMKVKDANLALNRANTASQIQHRRGQLSLNREKYNLSKKKYLAEEDAGRQAMLLEQEASKTSVNKFDADTSSRIVAKEFDGQISVLKERTEDMLRDIDDEKQREVSKISTYTREIGNKMAKETDPAKREVLRQEAIAYSKASGELGKYYSRLAEEVEFEEQMQLSEIQGDAKDYHRNLSRKKHLVDSSPEQKVKNLRNLMQEIKDPTVYKAVKKDYEKASTQLALLNKAKQDSSKENLEMTMKVQKHNQQMSKDTKKDTNKRLGNSVQASVAIKSIFNIDDDDVALKEKVKASVISKLNLFGVKPPYTKKVIEDSMSIFAMDRDAILEEAKGN